MVRIAPVRLEFNPKTLWFDACDLNLNVDDQVIVSTVRGHEFGTVAQNVFDMPYEEVKKLKSPLKSVERLATDDDRDNARELEKLSREALPVFKKFASEMIPAMNPVAVEYLFDGDKAVFYFESEERIDFRNLVRKLASELHIRVDMKQVGIRDSARMVGGYGHCGQELCCRRLGGEFNPVSIRMAKEQELSLNPQKISGVCGRLMCCLRYEYDTYKDFHSRAPKKNAMIDTPCGQGKVVGLDVPREHVSIQVDTDKPVKVPLSAMEEAEAGVRPSAVGQDAWDAATATSGVASIQASSLFSSSLFSDSTSETASSQDSRREQGEKTGSSTKRKRKRKRRSTKVESGAVSLQETKRQQQKGSSQVSETKQRASSARASQSLSSKSKNSRRNDQKRSTSQSSSKSQVGRNSSSLRRSASADQNVATSQQHTAAGESQGTRRKRRRSHKAGGDA